MKAKDASLSWSKRVAPGRSRLSGDGRSPSPLSLVILMVVMAGLFLAIMPVRTYLAQHRTEVSVSHRLSDLNRENKDLSTQIARLSTSAQIENIARSRYGLVEPGERSYVILPTTTTTTAAPAARVHR